MSFFSGKFLIFLFCVFAVYFASFRLIPQYQWVVLLISGFVFYTSASVKYVFFLLFSIVTTWGFGIVAENAGSRQKKILLAICFALNIGVLSVFKYSGLITGIFGMTGKTDLILPLGISFYTFQTLSYCMDIYRGKIHAEKNFFRYALFGSYFPQICEGPIGRFGALAPQLFKPHGFSYGDFTEGLSRAVIGAFKKLFVANTIAGFVDTVYQSSEVCSGAVLCLAAILYSFQIYADFSGYIDIALGISQCMGIKLTENFKAPDFALSVSDFWKRWHISLTSWFRDYLYIPLGGNRKGTCRKYLNKLLIFLVSGAWHGADLSFILWGAIHGIYVIAGEVLMPLRDSIVKLLHIRRESFLHKIFCQTRTFLLVSAAWIFFRADGITQAINIFKRIFTAFYYDGWTGGLFVQYDIHYFITVFIGLMILFLLEFSEQKVPLSEALVKKPLVVRWAVLYIIMLCLAYVLIFSNVKAADAANFIYFQF